MLHTDYITLSSLIRKYLNVSRKGYESGIYQKLARSGAIPHVQKVGDRWLVPTDKAEQVAEAFREASRAQVREDAKRYGAVEWPTLGEGDVVQIEIRDLLRAHLDVAQKQLDVMVKQLEKWT